MARLKTLIDAIGSSRVKKIDLGPRTKAERKMRKALIRVPNMRFRHIRIITSALEGTEAGVLSMATYAAAATERVKVREIRSSTDDLKQAIDTADIVLIAGDFPEPVDSGKPTTKNRPRIASDYANKKNVITYYIGEPYLEVVDGRTAESVGRKIAETSVHHIMARFGKERVLEIEDREFLRVVVVGTRLTDTSKVEESRRRASRFMDVMLKAFLNPKKEESK